MLQRMQLIASGEADFPPVIETVPGLIGLDGKPLSEQSAAYGQIRADLCCANAQVLQYFYQDPEQLYRLSARNLNPSPPLFSSGSVIPLPRHRRPTTAALICLPPGKTVSAHSWG